MRVLSCSYRIEKIPEKCRIQKKTVKSTSAQYESKIWKSFICVQGDGERRYDRTEIYEGKHIMEDDDQL